jgi:uncharacterized membrane protein
LLFIILPIIHSCVTTDKVTNSKIIQKRKYNKGFYVDLFSSKKTKSIKNNNEKQLVIKKIDLPDHNTKEPTESYFLNNENDNMPEIKDILLASTENPVIYPSIKEHSKIVFKNKKVQAKPKNTLIEKEYKSVKNKLNNLKSIPSDEKPKINKKVIAGFVLSAIGWTILILAFLFHFIPGIYIALLFSIPAIILCLKGYRNVKKEIGTGRRLALAGFITGFALIGAVVYLTMLYFVFSLLLTLLFKDGCSIY